VTRALSGHALEIQNGFSYYEPITLPKQVSFVWYKYLVSSFALIKATITLIDVVSCCPRQEGEVKEFRIFLQRPQNHHHHPHYRHRRRHHHQHYYNPPYAHLITIIIIKYVFARHEINAL